jgi:hypothetical protein
MYPIQKFRYSLEKSSFANHVPIIAMMLIVFTFQFIKNKPTGLIIGVSMLIIAKIYSKVRFYNKFCIESRNKESYIKYGKAPHIVEKAIKKTDFGWFTITVASRNNHRIDTFLKLELTLMDNTKIAVIEELSPWRDCPKDWDFKEFNEGDFNEIYYVEGGIKQLREQSKASIF